MGEVVKGKKIIKHPALENLEMLTSTIHTFSDLLYELKRGAEYIEKLNEPIPKKVKNPVPYSDYGYSMTVNLRRLAIIGLLICGALLIASYLIE